MLEKKTYFVFFKLLLLTDCLSYIHLQIANSEFKLLWLLRHFLIDFPEFPHGRPWQDLCTFHYSHKGYKYCSKCYHGQLKYWILHVLYLLTSIPNNIYQFLRPSCWRYISFFMHLNTAFNAPAKNVKLI